MKTKAAKRTLIASLAAACLSLTMIGGVTLGVFAEETSTQTQSASALTQKTYGTMGRICTAKTVRCNRRRTATYYTVCRKRRRNYGN